MSRRTREVVIETENRDKGKRFFITEMPAVAWAKWCMRATLAVSRSGHNVPAEFLQGGFAGVLSFGMSAITSCSFEDAEPLTAELMACVEAMPDPKRPSFRRPGGVVDEDFDEATTIFRLYEEVASVHLGFSLAAEWLKFRSAMAAAMVENSSIMSLSQGSSGASSLPN